MLSPSTRTALRASKMCHLFRLGWFTFDCLIGLLSYVHGSCWELASDFLIFLCTISFHLHEFSGSRPGVYDPSLLSADRVLSIPRIYVFVKYKFHLFVAFINTVKFSMYCRL